MSLSHTLPVPARGDRPAAGRRPALRLALALAALSLVDTAATPARADLAPSNSTRVRYTYEVVGPGDKPAATLVVWPRMCGMGGSPMGTIDLGSNPQWKARWHEVDYEVLVPGKDYEVGKFCAGSSHIYALPAREFKTVPAVADKDEWMLGLTAGQGYLRVPALDKLDLAQRIRFFGSAKARRAAYEFAPLGFVHRRSQATTVHDVLRVSAGARGPVTVAPIKVVYAFKDGKAEEIAYGASGNRPEPTRPNGIVTLKGGWGEPEEDEPKRAPPPPPTVEPPPAGEPAVNQRPLYRPTPGSGLHEGGSSLALSLGALGTLVALGLLLRARRPVV